MFLFGKKEKKPSNANVTVDLEKSIKSLDQYFERLSKKGINLSNHSARVFVVMDASGSMNYLFNSGEVQKILTRLFPLALKFDDNGELDVYIFNNSCKKMKSMTLDNYQNYVEKQILKRGYSPNGGTQYAPAINQTIYDYDDDSPYPAFGIFITDGENSDKDSTTKAIIESSNHKIFYQFIGIGNEHFRYLKHLDDLDGRPVDNTAFFDVSNLNALSDDELYSKLLEQYLPWLQAMNIN